MFFINYEATKQNIFKYQNINYVEVVIILNVKKLFPLITFTFIIIISLIYAANNPLYSSKNIELESSITLNEIQISACNAAYIGGTCDTKLKELNIVKVNDCCEVLGKCC